MATTITTITDRTRNMLGDTDGEQVDSCDGGTTTTSDWTAGSSATVTRETTAALVKEGDASVKTVLNAAAQVQAYKNFDVPKDLTQYDRLVFWIQDATSTATAGQLEIRLCASTNGVDPLESLDVPALSTAGVWTRAVVDFSNPKQLSHVASITLATTADIGADSIYIDDFRAEPSAKRWTDTQLQNHIAEALAEMSVDLPRRQATYAYSSWHVHVSDDITNIVTAATAASSATLYALLAEIADDYTLHVASTVYHVNADDVNAVTETNPPTDTAEAVLLANELMSIINAHMVGVDADGNFVHKTKDGYNGINEQACSAQDVNTIYSLANEIKRKYNDHLDQYGTGVFFDISSLDDLIEVTEVQSRIERRPTQRLDFTARRLDTLDSSSELQQTWELILGNSAGWLDDNEKIRVFYDTQHTLDTTTSTLTNEQERILVWGAAAYALRAYSNTTINEANKGDVAGFTRNFQDFFTLFRDNIDRLKAKIDVDPTIVETWSRSISYGYGNHNGGSYGGGFW